MTQPTSYQGDKKYQTHLYRFGAIRSDALMHQINFADGYLRWIHVLTPELSRAAKRHRLE